MFNLVIGVSASAAESSAAGTRPFFGPVEATAGEILVETEASTEMLQCGTALCCEVGLDAQRNPNLGLRIS